MLLHLRKKCISFYSISKSSDVTHGYTCQNTACAVDGKNGNCESESIVEEKRMEVCFQTLSRSFNMCTEGRALEQRMWVLQQGETNTRILKRRKQGGERGERMKRNATSVKAAMIQVAFVLVEGQFANKQTIGLKLQVCLTCWAVVNI